MVVVIMAVPIILCIIVLIWKKTNKSKQKILDNPNPQSSSQQNQNLQSQLTESPYQNETQNEAASRHERDDESVYDQIESKESSDYYDYIEDQEYNNLQILPILNAIDSNLNENGRKKI